ncbi:MAG: hypothetical protein PQJ46_09790, partial [Spirochaetales bacterium]|nr:hypothetical protein [Spirochaetales bacterium]
GLFSMLPYLPKMIALVAFFYIIAGAILLYFSKFNIYSPWEMGITFGTGHLLSYSILYQDIKKIRSNS